MDWSYDGRTANSFIIDLLTCKMSILNSVYIVNLAALVGIIFKRKICYVKHCNSKIVFLQHLKCKLVYLTLFELQISRSEYFYTVNLFLNLLTANW
jgi:hypothetical protein